MPNGFCPEHFYIFFRRHFFQTFLGPIKMFLNDHSDRKRIKKKLFSNAATYVSTSFESTFTSQEVLISGDT